MTTTGSSSVDENGKQQILDAIKDGQWWSRHVGGRCCDHAATVGSASDQFIDRVLWFFLRRVWLAFCSRNAAFFGFRPFGR